MELIDRIAAPVTPPRTHRHRYFGVQSRKILDHLGVDSEPPRISPARALNALAHTAEAAAWVVVLMTMWAQATPS